MQTLTQWSLNELMIGGFTGRELAGSEELGIWKRGSFRYLVELVDVIGKQVNNLACGGLSHGGAAETESLQGDVGRDSVSKIPPV